MAMASLLVRSEPLPISGTGLALIGCTASRKATGADQEVARRIRRHHQGAAGHPARFQPAPAPAGRAARNEPDPPNAAGPPTLFPQNGRASRRTRHRNYSDGEKMLLANTNALSVDPAIRARLNGVGQGDLRSRVREPRFTDQPRSGSHARSRAGPAADADGDARRDDPRRNPRRSRGDANWSYDSARRRLPVSRSVLIRLCRSGPSRGLRQRLSLGRPDQSAPEGNPVHARQRHADGGDPRSPRARRHPDAVVSCRRHRRSAGAFGRGPSLRASDVQGHQDRARRRILQDRRAQWRPGQRLHHSRLHRLLRAHRQGPACRW